MQAAQLSMEYHAAWHCLLAQACCTSQLRWRGYTDRQGTPNGQRSKAIRRARHIHASMQTPLNQHADPQSALHRLMCSCAGGRQHCRHALYFELLLAVSS